MICNSPANLDNTECFFRRFNQESAKSHPTGSTGYFCFWLSRSKSKACNSAYDIATGVYTLLKATTGSKKAFPPASKSIANASGIKIGINVAPVMIKLPALCYF